MELYTNGKSRQNPSPTGIDFKKAMYSIHTGPDAMSAPENIHIRNREN